MNSSTQCCISYTFNGFGYPLVLGMSLIKALVVLLFPVAVLKVVLAVMQGGSAWRNLGYIDIKEREDAEKKQ